MKVDVLLIHPAPDQATYQGLVAEFSAIDTPVWSLLLAEHIRQHNWSCAIHDMARGGWDDTVISSLMNRYQPKLAVLMVLGHHPSASTQTMPIASRAAADLKRIAPSLLVAMGGTHPSSLPERTLQEESIDFVIQGEGFTTVDKLLSALQGKGTIRNVPGLYHREEGRIIKNRPAKPLTDLNEELPSYAWDLLPALAGYRAHNWHCFPRLQESRHPFGLDIRSPYISLYTSLGCPYRCDFCCIHPLFGGRGIRYWSEERVIEWIDQLVAQHQIRNIRFADELFMLSPKRVRRLCDLLIDRNYRLNIWAYARVDTVQDDLLAQMKRAGINWLALGIESASERVRNGVHKSIRVDIADVVRRIQEHGIAVMGNYMFGLPEDDMRTMQETLSLALRLRCEFANFYTVMAYPGSALYDKYASLPEAQTILPTSWSGFSQHAANTQPLPTKYLSATEVLRFRDQAFMTYFQDPDYLSRVKSLYGPSAQNHITRMLAIKLKRNLLQETSAQ
jgi:anaerobic magnesium-protoporphyrin IX monomethyl ester cyclase